MSTNYDIISMGQEFEPVAGKLELDEIAEVFFNNIINHLRAAYAFSNVFIIKKTPNIFLNQFTCDNNVVF